MIRFTRPLILILFFASCSDPQGNLIDEYLNNARKIGIVPIYPPREEFQVGDIFLTSYVVDPNDALSVWVGEESEVVDLADHFMRRRIVFRTTDAGRSATEPVAAQTDTFGGSLTRRGALDIETLPAAAFPSFTADQGTTGALGITRVLQALGLARGRKNQSSLVVQ